MPEFWEANDRIVMNSIDNSTPEIWPIPEKEKCNRFYFFQRHFSELPCVMWLYYDNVCLTILCEAPKIPCGFTTNFFLEHRNEKINFRTNGILLVTNF